ncbi:uncharacterized protein N7482_009177 [Penicillium canariense]|uniref:DUF7730 domain-containing protein n=1 Tax=Penicillium canariense TaxID=189055 RepID=A0A9W9HSJ9_9EURO|nr:uncharacterized protein N7482_009177 [Penicillium canariense]KAJ5152699.1 hypothetical protein N7482_009177 [Penicillium canariense]
MSQPTGGTTSPSPAVPQPSLWILVPFAIIILPALPFAITYSVCRGMIRKLKAMEAPVRPLHRQRKRALTLPLPETSPGRKAQRTYDQSQSLFLDRLPFEIRHKIYEAILAPPDNRILHVAAISGRLCGIRCHETDPTRSTWCHQCWDPPKKAQRSSKYDRSPGLGLLCSCRQIYSESIDLLYAENCFSLRDLRAILSFPLAMLPQRIAAIRKMGIDTLVWFSTRDARSYDWTEASAQNWRRVCQVLSPMSACGLRRLDITLRLPDGGKSSETDKWATEGGLAGRLGALMDIHVPEFSVTLHDWPQSEEDVRQRDDP